MMVQLGESREGQKKVTEGDCSIQKISEVCVTQIATSTGMSTDS